MESGIYARHSSALGRSVQIGVASQRVLSVAFPEAPDDDAGGEHPVLDRLLGYLEGEADDFADVAVAFTVPSDHRAVLETLREVPYGEEVTVEALARMTPRLDAEERVQTIRAALAANPAPILVPDHRVRDGSSVAPPDVVERLRAVEGL